MDLSFWPLFLFSEVISTTSAPTQATASKKEFARCGNESQPGSNRGFSLALLLVVDAVFVQLLAQSGAMYAQPAGGGGALAPMFFQCGG